MPRRPIVCWRRCASCDAIDNANRILIVPPERWSWLGEPLAVDFANTVRRRGGDYTELLRTGADLCAWAEHEASRVPDPSEYAADHRLEEVRALRDAIFALLLSAAKHEPA